MDLMGLSANISIKNGTAPTIKNTKSKADYNINPKNSANLNINPSSS